MPGVYLDTPARTTHAFLDGASEVTRRNMVDYLPPEKAREDLDVFFTLLRTTYEAYEYFGGDEVFEKLKADHPKNGTPHTVSAYPAGDGPVFAAGGRYWTDILRLEAVTCFPSSVPIMYGYTSATPLG